MKAKRVAVFCALDVGSTNATGNYLAFAFAGREQRTKEEIEPPENAQRRGDVRDAEGRDQDGRVGQGSVLRVVSSMEGTVVLHLTQYVTRNT